MEGGAGRIVGEVAGHIEDDADRVGGAGRPVHGIELAAGSQRHGYAVGPCVTEWEVDRGGGGRDAAGERGSDGHVAETGLAHDRHIAGDRYCTRGDTEETGHSEALLGP